MLRCTAPHCTAMVHLGGAASGCPLAALQTGGGVCTHGRYCGKGCSGEWNGELYKAAPIDELDRACFWHDRCFGGGGCTECHCNAQLSTWANQVRGARLRLHPSAAGCASWCRGTHAALALR